MQNDLVMDAGQIEIMDHHKSASHPVAGGAAREELTNKRRKQPKAIEGE